MVREETHHPGPEHTLAENFFLVASNLILAWIVTDLAYRWRWDLASVLLCTMLASILYHSCRAGFGCIMRFRDHQMIDHIFVYFSLLYIAAKLIVRRGFFPTDVLHRFPQLIVHCRLALFFPLIFIAVLCNMYNPESGWVPFFCFLMPGALVVFSAVLANEPVFYNTTFGLIGAGLFAVSFVFYHFAPHSWYGVAHSLWHLFSMLSVYFIADAIEPPLRLVASSVQELEFSTGKPKSKTK